MVLANSIKNSYLIHLAKYHPDMKNYQTKAAVEEKSHKLKKIPCSKYMTKDLITFKPETPISEVIQKLLDNRISGAAVLDDSGMICGVIDDKDCLNTLIDSAYYNQPISKDKVENYMTNVYKRINVGSDIVDVANMFIRSNFKRLLVVDDDGRLKGSISRRDVLRAIRDMESTAW